MVLFFIIALFMIFVMYAIGCICFSYFKIEDKYGLHFKTPLGMVFLLFILQLVYYPIQFLKISTNYSHLATFIIIALVLLIFILKVDKNLIKKEFLRDYRMIIIGLLIFAALCFIYRYIEFPLRTDDCNFYVPYVYGKTYSSSYGDGRFFMYDFQGIYNLQSFFMFVYYKLSFLPFYEHVMPLAIVAWIPAIIFYFVFIFSAFDVYYFLKKNLKFDNCKRNILLFFSCFILLVSFYWIIAYPYYGNTYRRVTVLYLFYFIFGYLKYRDTKSAYLLMSSIFSLISQSSTGFFLSAMLCYAMLMYLGLTKKTGYLNHFSLIVLPIAIYMYIPVQNVAAIYLVIACYIFVLLINIFRLTERFETLFSRFSVFVLIVVPLAFTILPHLSIYPDRGIDITFFREHTFDMVHPYMQFLFDNKEHIITSVYNIVSLVGLFVTYFYLKRNSSELLPMHTIILIVILTFFNPFVCEFVSDFMTNIVYFRIYDIIFNTLTICLFSICLSSIFNNKTLNIIMLLFIFAVNVLQAGNSFLALNFSDDINPLYHAKNSEVEVLAKLREKMYVDDYYRQIVLVSQIYGTHLLADWPLVNLVNNRVDDIYKLYEKTDDASKFTQIFYRKLHDDPRLDTDFDDACRLLKEKNVEYVIIDRKYNYQMEDGLGYCGEVFLDYDNYRVYQMHYDWLNNAVE